MALYCRAVSLHRAPPSAAPPPPPPPLIPKQRPPPPHFKLSSSSAPPSPSSGVSPSSCFKALARTERADGGEVAEEDPPGSSSGMLGSFKWQRPFCSLLLCRYLHLLLGGNLVRSPLQGCFLLFFGCFLDRLKIGGRCTQLARFVFLFPVVEDIWSLPKLAV